jgi:hypothetical protein
MTTGRFLSGNPRIEFDADCSRAYNLADIKFEWASVIWTAPAGLVTDGASVPRVLWPTVGHPFDHDVVRGALIHDHYYARYAGTGFDAANEKRLRELVDKMFFAALLADGVSRWRAWAIYRGVRLGGWLAWRGHAARKRT